jgi:pimeloyl-ACP methyl ester carboxylesterase
VALRAALERPERVRRLVLAAAFARLPPSLRALQLALAAVARLLPSRALVPGLVAAVPEPYRADALREVDLSRAELARLMRDGARHDVSEAAARLTVPTLVLCGGLDRRNLRLSRDLADLLPAASFALVPGAGHVANLDCPEAFTAALRAFLR